MKEESQINQKQLVKLIELLNKQFKTKIKTKGSITDLAEAFATGVDALSNRSEPIPEEVIDFYNDLFADEAQGYKDVDIDKGAKAEPEEEPEEETEPLEEEAPLPPDEEPEELPELDPEEELPGEEDDAPATDEEEELLEEDDELEELEELDEPEPPKRGRGRPPKKPEPKKPAPKPTVKKPAEKKISTEVGNEPKSEKKEAPSMLDQLAALNKKPEVKEFVKTHSINVKLRNNESVQVWKAKIKKLVEAACPAPAKVPKAEPKKPAPKATPKPAPKQNLKPKAEPKAEKKGATKAEPKKPVKKAEKGEKKERKPRGDKDAFGVVKGSLTHAFVQAIYKKPQTMRMLIDSGVGKHPKTLKKMIAMGYMERDKTGIITMTAKGRKVYGGGEK